MTADNKAAAAYHPQPPPGDVTLTDAEQRLRDWLSAWQADVRQEGLALLGATLAAERERIAQAIEAVPCTRDHTHFRTRFARIARGDA